MQDLRRREGACEDGVSRAVTGGLSRRARDVAARLDGLGRRRVPLADARRAFAEADPSTSGSPERRRMLAEVLDELSAAGVLRPSGTVEPGTPPLPTQVTLLRPEQPARRPEAPVVWHPRLRDADGRPDPRGVLLAVNRWLFAQRGEPEPVPVRERALEITGDEKAFDGGLGPVLTLWVLRAYRVVLPLHRERLGDGPVLLVVENSDTYDSLRRVLADDPASIGEIGWGAGAAFTSSVLSMTDRPPGAISYFGDLDAAGLRIPAAASVLAEDAGLPPVRPATPLYGLLFEHGREQGGRVSVAPERARDLADWLDPPHRDRAETLLTGGVRLAQEAVGARVLGEDDAWRDALGGR